ncbi:hypothetical protein LMG26690_03400 [Achromobacter animicus]|uniref:Nucleotidyl transferase AbiEii/AbiGii toxin family protein n=1 Tax=Achromobacter animicus TaxID=1389935 RepID=A0A6S7A5N5_9BURK|nr:hypothetical protein LMG26690_03400 [Achromobacter animicus]
MNLNFQTVIQASGAERRGLFLTTAARLGTAVQHVEKDFWVCWVLDALFNGLPSKGPRLLFKGGTSLSKSFGLISRFSEDIDITVFRQDIGEPIEVSDLHALSGKQRRVRLDRIRDACRQYIAEVMAVHLGEIANRIMLTDQFRVELDLEDPDRQTLLFWYPAVTSAEGDYIRSAVKIEAGAKSALDPHESATVIPYIADDLADLDMAVRDVTTVKPERTFWDKIIILHGARQWHDRRGSYARAGSGSRVTFTTSTAYCSTRTSVRGWPTRIWLRTARCTRGCSSAAAIWGWTWRSAALSLWRRRSP